MISEKISQLTAAYEQQINFYKQMYVLAVSQEKLCTSDDFPAESSLDELNSLLGLRQGLMQQIDEKQKKVHSARESLEKNLGVKNISGATLAAHCPFPETEQLQAVLRQIEPVLRKIASLDLTSQQALQSKLGSVKKGMKKIQQGKQTTKAYHPAPKQTEGFFIDRK